MLALIALWLALAVLLVVAGAFRRKIAAWSPRPSAVSRLFRRTQLRWGLIIPTPVGGHVVIAFETPITVPVAQWEGNWEGRMAETTMTDGGGFTSYRVYVVDPEWSFTIYYDTTDAAIVAGFTHDAVIDVNFLLGSFGRMDTLHQTTVGGIKRVLDAKGETPIGVTIHGKGGRLAMNVAA